MAKNKEDLKQGVAQEPKVPFDAWWARIEPKIAVHHRKEIIVADFKARGLTLSESIKSYDACLEKYGLKV